MFHRFLSRAVSGPRADLGRFRLCETALKQRLAASGAPETDYAQKPETQTILSDALVLLSGKADIPWCSLHPENGSINKKFGKFWAYT